MTSISVDVTVHKRQLTIYGQEQAAENPGGPTGPVDWNDIEDKPTTFPPSAHNHDDRYYTESEITAFLATKSDVGHNHDSRYYTESEIDDKLADVDAALELKQDEADAFDGDYNSLANKPTLFSGAYADLSGKPTLFSGAYSDLSGKPTTFPPEAHNHDDRYYTEAEADARYPLKSAISASPMRVGINEYFLSSRECGAGYTSVGPSTTTVNSNNLARVTPFSIDETISVDALALYVVAANAGASAVLRLGIYADNGSGRPGSVVVDAGTASINTTGMKTITFSQVQLTPGKYWAVMVYQSLDTAGANPTYACSSSGFQTAPESSPAGSNNMFPYWGMSGMSGAFTASPTMTIARSLTAPVPHIWIRRSA